MAGCTEGARDAPLLVNGRTVAQAPAASSSASAGSTADASAGSSPAGRLSARGSDGPALAGEFNYVPPVVRPLPPVLKWISDRAFGIFLFVAFAGTLLMLFITYFVYSDHDDSILFLRCQKEWKDLFKYASIPLVSIVFTWWHVWLGIQMCFYPVEFRGCCKPYLGWQGIVPRRANTMASRACDIMIGSLLTVEEIIERIHAEEFFSTLKPQLSQTISAVLGQIADRHFPDIWNALPQWSKDEIRNFVLSDSEKMFDPVISDLKVNINQIIDFKQMAIEILTENKALLVAMFSNIGRCEFVFIQRISAVMGCLLGVFQMLLWILLNPGGDGNCSGAEGHSFRCWGGFVLLPVSGLIIGYFTNWLGITLIFRPVMPRIICGGYINVQGVFLKRQQEVSQELSEVICKHLVCAERIVEYIVKKDFVLDKILRIYKTRLSEQIERVSHRVPFGHQALERFTDLEVIKADVVETTKAELPKHKNEIEAYIDRSFDLAKTISHRLSRLNPERFEGMLHPVFQEDEWMVLLLGGVLGVCVGTLQAVALGS